MSIYDPKLSYLILWETVGMSCLRTFGSALHSAAIVETKQMYLSPPWGFATLEASCC